MSACILSGSIVLLMTMLEGCSGQSKENAGQMETHEMEIIPKVKEPQAEVVDTFGFPEESQGTPITGYQGYPEDDLVHESNDDEVAGFEGGADIDYYNGGSPSGY